MHSAARLAYAQTRIQGRHGLRPSAAFWSGVDAGRDLEHVIELIRASPYREAVLPLSAQVDVHTLERLLRAEWREACDEVAGWYPQAWQPAFRWMRWLPLLPGLTWLAAGKTPQPWMHDDPVLAPLLKATDFEAALADSELAPLAAGFKPGENVRAAWRTHWRSLWQPLPQRHARGLERLDAAIALRLLPAGERSAADFETVIEETTVTIERLFRRHAGTPVAGLAYVMLGALDRLHLRAALSTVRVFGRKAAS